MTEKKMKFYLAPMEGVTGYVYRGVYQELFHDMDYYMTPFVTPAKKKILKTRDQKEVAPEHNAKMAVIPQIMSNQAAAFLETARYLQQKGYQEVNLNLGCPASTVVTKGKGSGFLADPYRMELFFEQVFDQLELEKNALKISVKTRLGMRSAEEFEEILEVYNRYPFSEVIIHPRVRMDFYKNEPNLDAFGEALEASVHPVCYNGDLKSSAGYEELIQRFPKLERIMMGRGIIRNPGLIRQIKTGQRTEKEEYRRYHDRLYERYQEELGSQKNALFRMKEFWFYFGTMFPEAEKERTRIMHSSDPVEYQKLVEKIWLTKLEI